MATHTTEFGVPKVYSVRGMHIVLDEDVARIFGVETRRLNEQIKRNAARFDEDYVFRLTEEEAAILTSRIATSSPSGLTPSNLTSQAATSRHGGRRHLPYVFTDLGVVMAATVLRTDRAIVATRAIVRTFVEVERAKSELPSGSNMPVVIDTKASGEGFRQGLMLKINAALDKVMDAMIDPGRNSTVRDEAQALIAHGLEALKDHLRSTGIQNEKSLAEIKKILAEVEVIHAESRKSDIDNRHHELALLAKQLRMILAAQKFAETGALDTLDAVLRELSVTPA